MSKKLLFSVLIAILALGALRAFNAVFIDVVTGNVLWAWHVARTLALVAVAVAVWFASARLEREVTAALFAATFLFVLAAGYAIDLATPSVRRFGAAVAGRPGTFPETYPRRGEHVYRVNSFGFRGPEWDAVKAAGTVRGVVIGDSMVFGSGVDDGDTITATLTDRLRRAHAATAFEILNLGVPGSNLPNYVELYRAAEERLAPDFVVLCLFFPNDLGGLEQPSEEGRFGLFSFFRFLLGQQQNPYTFYAMRWSEARSEEAKLAFLAHHMEAIERIRRAPLFVFFYWEEPAWTQAVRSHLGAGAWIVEHPPLPDGEFIAGDGHPTAAGNRHLAELIADAIERSPAAPMLFGRDS